jgi:hypothetical protein
VIVPVAAVVPPLMVGYVEFGPGFVGSGLFAVPLSDAVSLSVSDRTHGLAAAPVLSAQPADVVSVGVAGVTVKHSSPPLSSSLPMPAFFDAVFGTNWACQQYCPEPAADVRLAVELPVIPESEVL